MNNYLSLNKVGVSMEQKQCRFCTYVQMGCSEMFCTLLQITVSPDSSCISFKAPWDIEKE